MDVHDGLGTDETHAMWEPPGYDDSGSTAGDAHGYDGYDDTTGHDSAGGYDDSSGSSTGSSDASDSASTDDGTGSGDTSGTEGSSTMTVEVDGQTRELPAEHDYTGDGQNDAAVETDDGKVIIFSDTENNETGDAGPDGKADEAYIVDKESGQVVGTAHIDPSSGTWVEGTDPDGPSAVGDGSGSGTTDGTEGTGTDGTEGTTVGTDGGSGSGGPDNGVVTVTVDGHEIGVEKTIDTNNDGVADSGVVYEDGKAVILTDTGGSSDAEQVAVVDTQTGQVTDVAHVDPQTGEWEEGPAPEYSGGSSDDGSSDGSYGDDGGTTGTTGTEASTTTGSGSMSVEVDGQTRELPADHDYTGDGQNDAAVETDDGRVIIFADTENNETGDAGPDGKADEAYIVDKASGQVVGTAHVDPQTGEWVDGVDQDGPSAVPASAGPGDGS